MQTMINPGRLPGSLILRALLEVMLPAGSALAADGVIEINQARARAGGVSADDEPGFPVTPSRSGSYRKLQVNVQVPLEAPVGIRSFNGTVLNNLIANNANPQLVLGSQSSWGGNNLISDEDDLFALPSPPGSPGGGLAHETAPNTCNGQRCQVPLQLL